MPKRSAHIADTIDRLLAAPKSLQGQPTWRDWGQHGEARIIWPILVRGEISQSTYVLIAYPRKKPIGFRICLNAPSNIFRLDFNCESDHTNSFSRPHDLKEYYTGPRHYHAWSDNRHFATARALPKELPNARSLPPRIRTFHQAQRWFCGETNIRVKPGEVVDLPPSDLLL
jgi:hypothetical protein